MAVLCLGIAIFAIAIKARMAAKAVIEAVADAKAKKAAAKEGKKADQATKATRASRKPKGSQSANRRERRCLQSNSNFARREERPQTPPLGSSAIT